MHHCLFILRKEFINFTQIFRKFILWSMTYNEVYDIKCERWSWKWEVQQKCVYNFTSQNFHFSKFFIFLKTGVQEGTLLVFDILYEV